MRFADPKNDLAFKKIFGNEQHKEILISFLNSVLDFKGSRRIKDIKIVNPYQVPKIPELKETILDIKAKNEDNEEFIVELQKKNLHNFAKRSLYYTSKAYISQLPKNNDYNQLKKVYFIGIVNFEIFETEDYISRHLILDQKTLKQELKDFEFTFIELPKFNKQLNELNSTLDKWIYFIKHAQDLTMIPKEFENITEFKEAFEIAERTTWSKDELDIYDDIALKQFDDINAIMTAERKARMEIAKNLLDVLDDETIAKKTGISVEEVRELRGRQD